MHFTRVGPSLRTLEQNRGQTERSPISINGQRLPDLQYDLAGLVWCARKHALRLSRLRKWQD